MYTGDKAQYGIAEDEQNHSRHCSQTGKDAARGDAQKYGQGYDYVGNGADNAERLCYCLYTGCIIVELCTVGIIFHCLDHTVQDNGNYTNDEPVEDRINIRQEPLAPVKDILNDPVAKQHGDEIEEGAEHVTVVTGYVEWPVGLEHDPADDGNKDPLQDKRQYKEYQYQRCNFIRQY